MRQQDDAALDEASRPWCMEKNTVYYKAPWRVAYSRVCVGLERRSPSLPYGIVLLQSVSDERSGPVARVPVVHSLSLSPPQSWPSLVLYLPNRSAPSAARLCRCGCKYGWRETFERSARERESCDAVCAPALRPELSWSCRAIPSESVSLWTSIHNIAQTQRPMQRPQSTVHLGPSLG